MMSHSPEKAEQLRANARRYSKRLWAERPEEARARYRKKREKNPEGWRKWQLKKNFGITIEQYDLLLAKQNSVCAICGRLESVIVKGIRRRLTVDHDHNTGKVRGLLCLGCNISIGRFNDDIGLLNAAVEYLRENQTNETGLR